MRPATQISGLIGRKSRILARFCVRFGKDERRIDTLLRSLQRLWAKARRG
jgi:hypothetical protein